MAISFPSSPADGDTHLMGGVLYTYDSAQNQWVGNTFLSGGGITPDLLTADNTPTDGQILSYEDSDSEFKWIDAASGGGGGLAFQNLHTGGGTLTFTTETTVMVILVGGGAGGEHVGSNSANTGGSGRKLIGYLDAPAGTYTLTQGGAGAGAGAFNAGSGGASSAFGFTAPGGTQNNGGGGAPTIPTDGIQLYSAVGPAPSSSGSNTPSGDLDATAQSIISSGGLGVTIAVANDDAVSDLSALYTNIHRAGTGGRNTDAGNPVNGRAGYVAVFY